MQKLVGGASPNRDVLPFIRAGWEFAPTVTQHSQQNIATNLQAMYAELVQQPLPHRFVELLAQLDQNQREKP
jgi:hypothetical protein